MNDQTFEALAYSYATEITHKKRIGVSTLTMPIEFLEELIARAAVRASPATSGYVELLRARAGLAAAANAAEQEWAATWARFAALPRAGPQDAPQDAPR